MKPQKTRQSNLELLRIISMLYIILYHILIHSILPQYRYLDDFIKPTITTLHIGVICFVLISGYCMITFSIKSLLKIVIPCLFYCICFIIIGTLFLDYPIKEVLELSSPFQWWYVNVYFTLLLLTPIINIPLKKSNSRQILFFTFLLGIVSGLCSSFVPTLADGKNPINFIFIYYVGYCLKVLYNKSPSTFVIKKASILYALLNVGLGIILLITATKGARIRDILFYKIFFPYASFGLLLNAVLFFIIFIKINWNIKWINTIASSTYAVYLLHENKWTGRLLYPYISEISLHFSTFGGIFLLALLSTLLIFSITIIVEKICQPIYYFIEQKIVNNSRVAYLEQRVKYLVS